MPRRTLRLPHAGPAFNTAGVDQASEGRVPRTLEAIQRDNSDIPALRGLVGVLHEKLQLRARYAFLQYESSAEGRDDISDLYRSLSRLESKQIALIGAALADELPSTGD
jgi:hypothetical protein